MALILGLETSSVNCSVALIQDGEVIISRDYSEGYSHAENVHPFIEEVLKEKGFSMRDLEAVIVGAGPGSFTGLRIGSSAAKGICYALSIPLLSLSSLENMAIQIRDRTKELGPDVLYCPLIDARRMEVYTALFNAKVDQMKEPSAEVVDEHTFADLLKENNVVFFGDGMPKVRELFAAHPNAHFIDNILPSAKAMSTRAEDLLTAGKTEDVAYFEPFYLKGFHATTPKKQL